MLKEQSSSRNPGPFVTSTTRRQGSIDNDTMLGEPAETLLETYIDTDGTLGRGLIGYWPSMMGKETWFPTSLFGQLQ